MITSRRLKETAEQDFLDFIKYTRSRPSLIACNTSLKNPNLFKNLYELHYVLYNMLITLKNNSHDSHTRTAINFIQESLISSIDLINMEYFKPAKKEYRSLIESIFRLSLACSRYRIYENRKTKHCFSATSELKNLLSKLDTHKIGTLTSFTVDYYSNTLIGNDIKNLNDFYSDYSAIIHTNDNSRLDFKLQLEALSRIDIIDIENTLKDFFRLMKICISVCYFSITNYLDSESLSQQDFYFIIHLAKDDKFENHITDISEKINSKSH